MMSSSKWEEEGMGVKAKMQNLGILGANIPQNTPPLYTPWHKRAFLLEQIYPKIVMNSDWTLNKSSLSASLRES